jgi:hypothetical protein
MVQIWILSKAVISLEDQVSCDEETAVWLLDAPS